MELQSAVHFLAKVTLTHVTVQLRGELEFALLTISKQTLFRKQNLLKSLSKLATSDAFVSVLTQLI